MRTRALLEAKANPNAQRNTHVTALNLACEEQHEACALLLLQAGALADVEDDWGNTPRTVAQKKGLTKVIALMK